MGRVVLAISIIGLSLAATSSGVRGEDEPEAFKGRIFLRDGNSAEFLYLGESGKVFEHRVKGKLQGHAVSYPLTQLAAVVFADPLKSYSDKGCGDLVIENREGKRFTLRHCGHPPCLKLYTRRMRKIECISQVVIFVMIIAEPFNIVQE